MNFYFAESNPEQATVTLVGIPLDRTSAHIPGTRFGPMSARIGAENIETFSPYQERDVADVTVHDAGDLSLEWSTPERPLDLIRDTTRANHAAGRKQLAIGGEHTITPAIVSELSRAFPDLCVIQFDAHSDLRDSYLGESWSHATAMRRVLDTIPRDRLFQLGIRSFASGAEMETPGLFRFEVLQPIEEVRNTIGRRPTYVTLDVDVLDPGTMPDVQTPQPGGCSYRELVQALAALSGLDIVGADIVEFCPRGVHPTPGASLVAELVREMILLLAPAD